MELELEHNELTGSVPQSLLALDMLTSFFFQGNAGLCAPNTAEFVAWLQSIDDFDGPYCSASSMLSILADRCSPIGFGFRPATLSAFFHHHYPGKGSRTSTDPSELATGEYPCQAAARFSRSELARNVLRDASASMPALARRAHP